MTDEITTKQTDEINVETSIQEDDVFSSLVQRVEELEARVEFLRYHQHGQNGEVMVRF